MAARSARLLPISRGLTIAATILALAGCNVMQNRHGPPPILQGSDVAAASANKLVLLRALAQDASIGGERASDWYLIAEAGFNFVDDQCRAYFDELFFLDRRKNAIRGGLNAADKTTAAILAVTGATVPTMNIVAQAFGFAVNVTDLVAGTYLYQLPPATTKGFVSKLQIAYREGAARSRATINSPTSAYYFIQGYLDLCLPPRIEAEITKQISASTAGAVLRDGGLFSIETESLSPEPTSTQSRPRANFTGPTPDDQIGNGRPTTPTPPPTLEWYQDIIARYNPKVHSIARVEPALVKLCVPGAELRSNSDRTKALIQVYQQTTGAVITGKLTRTQLADLGGAPDCVPNGVKNFYEANRMPGGLNSVSVIQTLNRVLSPKLSETTTVSVADVRVRLPEVRKAIAGKLKLNNPLLADQFTDDMMQELFKRGL